MLAKFSKDRLQHVQITGKPIQALDQDQLDAVCVEGSEHSGELWSVREFPGTRDSAVPEHFNDLDVVRFGVSGDRFQLSGEPVTSDLAPARDPKVSACLYHAKY